MDGQGFLRIIDQAFKPFLNDLGFAIGSPSISVRFYRVDFEGHSKIVSITYELGDNVLFIMLLSCKNGRISNIDDRTETPRLSDLNRSYMPYVTDSERIENERLFCSIYTHDREEHLLVKSAKELRLVLPKHLRA